MINKRASKERGHFNFGWLETYHTFSFGEYQDPKHVHFRSLRVINEDTVSPGKGFGEHPHQDMEILTYVISGAIAHKDSMGNQITIPAGNIQIMSAGTGITHSEFNPSPTHPLHLYQIWMLPQEKGLPPRYDQKDISLQSVNEWHKIGSPEPSENGVQIFQDIYLYSGKFKQNTQVPLPSYRYGWVQVVSGSAQIGEMDISAGDGVSLHNEGALTLTAQSECEVLFFDLA